MTVTLWDGDPDDETPDTKEGGQKVVYTYVVEIMSANGNWVESLTGDGVATTNTADNDPETGLNEGQAKVNINFDSTHQTNAYRITITFENGDIGTVSATKLGS